MHIFLSIHLGLVVEDKLQWNLSIAVTHGLTICGCNREVAALKRCIMCGVCHLELELVNSCGKMVAALHSDHYMQV